MPDPQTPPTPSVAQARALVAVIEEGGFTGASQRLGIDRPTVWRQLNRLSKALGFPLFETLPNDRIAPTAFARALLPPAREIAAAAVRFEVLAEQGRGRLVGALSVGAYPAVVANVVAPALEAFAKLDTSDRIAVHLPMVDDSQRIGAGEGLLEQLVSGDLDIAVGPAGRGTDGIEERFLYEWRLVAVDPSQLLGPARSPIGAADLAGVPLLVSPVGHGSRRLIDETMRSAGRTYVAAVESASVEALVALARHGRGVAVLPDDSVLGAARHAFRPLRASKGGPALKGRYAVYWRTPSDSVQSWPRSAALDEARATLASLIVKEGRGFRP